LHGARRFRKGWWKRGKLGINGGKDNMACWVDKSTLVSKELLENLNAAWFQESERMSVHCVWRVRKEITGWGRKSDD
jgi:hypothetical protein